jgi:hypothetical protein
MDKNISDQMLLIAELTIKVAAMERLLLKQKVLTQEELTGEMKKVSEEIISVISTQQTLAAIKDTKQN